MFPSLMIKIQDKITKKIANSSFCRKISQRSRNKRVEEIFQIIKDYLPPQGKLLDIGCGPGDVTKILRNKDYNVTGLDIKDISFNKNVKPIIYNGKKMPFSNNNFDIGLLVYVLHHSKDPEVVLSEAKRVCKRIIILEELLSSKPTIHNMLIYPWDSLTNLEFFGHARNYKTHKEWQGLFEKLDLKLKDHKKSTTSWIIKDPIRVYFLSSE